MNALILLFVLAALLGLSAFFSSAETALFSLNKFQVRRIQHRHPFLRRHIENLIRSPRRTLTTVLIGNMLVNLSAATLATALAIRWFGARGIGISIGVTTFCLLLFGEITPKRIAIRSSETLAAAFALPLELFALLFFPFRFIIRPLVSAILRFAGIAAAGEKREEAEEELKALVALGEESGAIDKDEREMLNAIFEFGERSCNEIMTPRVDIIACDVHEEPEEIVRVMKKNRHTKIPIFEESVDKILGFIYTKDYMLNRNQEVRTLLREVVFIPEAQKIDDLLKTLQRKQIPMAIVIDEYGGTAGLITIEDILEEVVGEIHDEYDVEGPLVEKIDGHTMRVEGDISLADLERKTGIRLESEEVETLGGYLLSILERFPTKGERVRAGGHIFEIEEVGSNRIKKVLIEKQDHGTGGR
ncbi:MAG: HlyC/CorC family transporter [Candidatus Omnitrophica bacterium]|nr:HlyC/CorC family transporter [Candidatus Omnitrophota bacterium]